MRYDSEELVKRYKESGQFPEIHNDIFNFILNIMPVNARMLDLGCSTGLLTIRLQRAGFACIGIDGDMQAITKSPAEPIRDFIPAPVIFKEVKQPYIQFFEWLDQYRCNTLVARRILPELFGHDLPLGKAFIMLLRHAGINRIFLEGRKAHQQPVNALATVDDEIELLSDCYELKQRAGNCAYLTAKIV